VPELQAFLRRGRSDRFFALWVLEATPGIRRCELAGARRGLLNLDARTLAIERTRVSVDDKVIESDGKTENAQRVLALDPSRWPHCGHMSACWSANLPSLAWTTKITGCCSAGIMAARPPGHHHAPVQEAGRRGRSPRD
jgi:hypothetical protein